MRDVVKVVAGLSVAAAVVLATVAVVAWTGAPHEHTEPEGPCPDIHFAREDVGNTTVYTVDEIRNGSYRVDEMWFTLEFPDGNFSETWTDRFGDNPWEIANASNVSWYDYEDEAPPSAQVNVGDRLTLNRSGLERMDVYRDPDGRSHVLSIGGTWDCGDHPEGLVREYVEQ